MRCAELSFDLSDHYTILDDSIISLPPLLPYFLAQFDYICISLYFTCTWSKSCRGFYCGIPEGREGEWRERGGRGRGEEGEGRMRERGGGGGGGGREEGGGGRGRGGGGRGGGGRGGGGRGGGGRGGGVVEGGREGREGKGEGEREGKGGEEREGEDRTS